MNDIEVLKERIKSIKEYDTYRYDWTETDIQLVENLIKTYKELEKENERLHELLCNIHSKYRENNISKSLIKEKIEEWKKRLEIDERLDWIIRDKTIINVLEELLTPLKNV